MSRSGAQSGVSHVVLFMSGLPFLAAAFAFAWSAETAPDLGRWARGARLVPLEPDTAADGQLIAVTGAIRSDRDLTDPAFLKPGAYLCLERIAETYAWRESAQTDKGFTKYEYDKTWMERPADSSRFHSSTGHHNPSAKVTGAAFRPPSARIGCYDIAMRAAQTEMENLPLAADLLYPGPDSLAPLAGWRPQLKSGYIYVGLGWPLVPAVGDTRVSFKVLSQGTVVTCFGQQVRQRGGARLEPHPVPGGDSSLHVLIGGRESAVEKLAYGHTAWVWFLRFMAVLFAGAGLFIISAVCFSEPAALAGRRPILVLALALGVVAVVAHIARAYG